MATSLATRALGGRDVSAIGLGCMPMSWGYLLGERDDAESVRLIEAALEQGVTHVDTALLYGPEHNETLVGLALHGGQSGVVVASKCGMVVEDPATRQVRRDGRPETLRGHCEASLRRLGVESIDLYYLHRVDPDVPVEESWGALAGLVSEGKIRTLGLSECTVDELARAHAQHPVTALQSEFSLWTRDPIETGALAWCRDNGAAFVAFAVLGRGFLTGALPPDTTFPPGDFRATNPRFQPDAMRANLALVERIRDVARAASATPAQVCIAWVLAQGEHVLAIPGTKRLVHLEENLAADGLVLDATALEALDAMPGAVGARYG